MVLDFKGKIMDWCVWWWSGGWREALKKEFDGSGRRWI
jgi:hypothetical protein